MKSYDVSYFCEKDNGPVSHIHVDQNKFEGSKWPYTLVLNSSESSIHSPRVIIYIDSLEDLLKFRNSVVFEVDSIELAIKEASNV
jgi:predicted RND superfamily exporter protein